MQVLGSLMIRNAPFSDLKRDEEDTGQPLTPTVLVSII